MLEIVTDVVDHLEDAGDELNTEFATYQKGGGAYSGGTRIAGLIRAVIHFLNRWRMGKTKFDALVQQQTEWRQRFQPEPSSDATQLTSGQEAEDGQDR